MIARFREWLHAWKPPYMVLFIILLAGSLTATVTVAFNELQDKNKVLTANADTAKVRADTAAQTSRANARLFIKQCQETRQLRQAIIELGVVFLEQPAQLVTNDPQSVQYRSQRLRDIVKPLQDKQTPPCG